ncbi:MAG: hypothetical protein KKA07_03640 [Bacteroidetes bacterium]|nr:hypothetical protein [Bacteroidota bacterium]MBU1718146.1 hypothetical protein [Bacteroidota bacterium]
MYFKVDSVMYDSLKYVLDDNTGMRSKGTYIVVIRVDRGTFSIYWFDNLQKFVFLTNS